MEKQKKSGAKKVGSIIGNILIWIFVAFSVLMTVFAFASQNNKYGARSIGGKVILNILTDSMTPTLEEGDIVIGTELSDEEKAQLKVDQIITFKTDITELGKDGEGVLVSHRIIEVRSDGGYVTKGDKQGAIADERIIYPADIACVVNESTRIAKLGAILRWLQTPNGFLIAVVLPLVLFFALEIFLFIKKVKEVRGEGKKEITAAEEELIKQRAIEEYLRQQAAEQAAGQAEAKPEAPSSAEEK